MKRFFILVLVLFFSLSSAFGLNDTEIYNNLDSYIKKVCCDWDIPGMSVTVIKDGKVFLSQGYGVKVKDHSGKVDTNTVFQIGSVSKSFSAVLVAMLVDEGKFTWDDRMIDLLPEFDLYGDTLEQEVLLRDVMTHHIGLPKQSLTNLPYLGYDGDDILKMFPLVKPNAPLRGKLQYNNMTFQFIRKLIEKYSGKSYEENLRTRIFEPLGLTSAGYGKDFFLDAKNVSGQHSFALNGDEIICNQFKGDARSLNWMTVVGPAGGIVANSSDVAGWAEFHRMGGIAPNGKRLVSKEQMDYLHKGISIISDIGDPVYGEAISLYGNCWYVEQNSKFRVYYHTGSTWGQGTLCLWIPEQNLSIGMIFNSDAPASVRKAIMYRAYDLFKGNPDVDYSNLVWEQSQTPKKKSASKKKAPSGFVVDYSSVVPTDDMICGTYDKGEIFGQARIKSEWGKLYIIIGPKGWKHQLKHVKGNEYSFYSEGKQFRIRFALDGDDTVKGFDIDFKWMERFGLWDKIK